MSWHCSLALEEALSDQGLLVTASSVRLRTARTASRSSSDDKRTGVLTPSRSGTMLEPSKVHFSLGLMSYLLDSLASPSPKPGVCLPQPTSVIFGQRPLGSLAKRNQEECYWRTSPDLFGCTEALSSETFPIWGSIADGELYQHEMPEPRIYASVGGVWPTPTARDWKDSVYCSNVPVNKLLGRTVWEGPGSPGRLNPDWVEWLMGMPIGWTSLEPLAANEILSWEKDPCNSGDIPRLTTERKHRDKRLKALGNGQVPAQVALAWKVLLDE
jgi:hypothetical protein